MNYLHTQAVDLGAETAEDAQISIAVLVQKADAIRDQLLELSQDDEARRSDLHLALANLQVDLNQGKRAWENAHLAFQIYALRESWEQAVSACDTLFRADQPQSLAALGHAVWLSVTYPVDPALTISQLQHIIDETPDDSDGAAVAAATAAYIADLRGYSKNNDNLSLAVGQMLNSVARRHADINDQAQFDAWFKSLELDQPSEFLPRLRNIIDVLVQDDWWIDRESLQARLPIQ